MKWRVIAGGWTVLAILFGLRTILNAPLYGKDIFWPEVGLTLCGILTWLALTPAMFWLSRKFPLGRDRWGRSLLGHLVGMAVVIPVDISLYVVLDRWVFGAWHDSKGMPPDVGQYLARIVVGTFPLSVFFYGAAVGLCHAFDYHDLVRDREKRALQLETRLAQAHVQVLRMQLQPHFLFNTLNAISALVHDDPAAADRMITRLSDLLRLTLAHQGRQEIPLKEEIELLDAYVEIERMRFRDRLIVTQEIRPETLDALVPSLLLQPLVENAVRHGIQPRSGGGKIEISSELRDHRLRIGIQDDGRGLPNGKFREGLGLANTRDRLATLYGPDHVFEIAPRDGGGVSVTIELPFKPAEE